MIELGKYNSKFYVQGTDSFQQGWLSKPLNYKKKSINDKVVKGDYIIYKGFDCVITEVEKDSYELQLMTNDPNEFIPIVV